jgi:3-deoxy-D-manno-octulosonate 8-phosphate phosphatase (KDO 8-P phosphatase)
MTSGMNPRPGGDNLERRQAAAQSAGSAARTAPRRGGTAELAAIKLIIFDVDGVLTDGQIVIDERGVESKHFHVRDGFAIKAAMAMGLRVGVLSGRTSRATALRVEELGVDLCLQGAADKAVGFETVCQKAGVLAEEAAYVGDDLIDLPALMRCGYPIAVADAVSQVRALARYVTQAPGGRAAAREVIEHILSAQGRWDEVIERFGV